MITKLPESIGKFNKSKEKIFGYDHIVSLPESLGNLVNHKLLNEGGGERRKRNC